MNEVVSSFCLTVLLLDSEKIIFYRLYMRIFRKTLAVRTALFFLFLSFQSALSAQTNHPSFEPLFTTNRNSTGYTADEVFEAGLLFSEIERGSQTWISCLQDFQKIKENVSSEAFMALSEEERGRAILKYLYNDYLRTYNFDQTRIDLALKTGFYNCVSSAVIYMAAAKAAGLDVRGQRTTQHAFCSVYVPSAKAGQLKKIDVETTNPYGFNPGSKEEIEHSDQIKKYYVVPKKYYANRSEVSDGVFVGLIGGNLTSDYIKSGEYHKAVPLGAARWEAVKAEPGKAAASVRNEFDILAANYVNLVPDSAATYFSTLDWFAAFIERWGNNSFLQKNLDTSFVNLLVLCNQEKNYELAREGYEKYKDKVSASQITKADEIITDIIILTATNGLSLEEKLEETNRLISSEELSTPARQKRAELHLESFWLEELNALMNSRDYESGYERASLAVNQLPKSSKIKTMQNGFYNNIIATIHNSFAKEANAGSFESAQKILEEGLEKFPNDRTLKKDLVDLQKIF